MKIDNRALLIIIAVTLVGIFGIILMENNKRSSSSTVGDSISEVIDSADEGIKEFKEEAKDEIDDNTDAKP
jgi:hypothetical protein